jgi:hypothetical protein
MEINHYNSQLYYLFSMDLTPSPPHSSQPGDIPPSLDQEADPTKIKPAPIDVSSGAATRGHQSPTELAHNWQVLAVQNYNLKNG